MIDTNIHYKSAAPGYSRIHIHNYKGNTAESPFPITSEVIVIPMTKYAQSGEVSIAYQTFGEGDFDLVITPGFISNLEFYWDDIRATRWLNSLGRFARVTIFDKRGTGLSDRVKDLPSMDTRIDDMKAVMDAAGIQEAALFGVSEGGSMAAYFAAHHPERCRALVIYGGFAKFSTWFPTMEALEQFFGYVRTQWGSGGLTGIGAPSLVNDPAAVQSIAKFERSGASPSAVEALMRVNSTIDITDSLAEISIPTLVIHKTGDAMINVSGGRELASLIPGARLFEMPGIDHLPWHDDCDMYIAEVEEFLTGSRSDFNRDRKVATILFSDIVNSTKRADALGDRAWRDLLDLHDKMIRKQLGRFKGTEIKSLGDGFMSIFDTPSSAIAAAQAMRDEANRIGVDLRLGMHAGEVEITDKDVRGIGVHIAARVSALAPTNGILVSSTVKELVTGSGIAFSDFGTHELKGVPDSWRLLQVA